jgi:hypothetical protein
MIPKNTDLGGDVVVPRTANIVRGNGTAFGIELGQNVPNRRINTVAMLCIAGPPAADSTRNVNSSASGEPGARRR